MGKCLEYPIKIVQGVSFVWPITFLQSDRVTPRILSGYHAKMQIRSSVESTAVIQELSTENGMITINETAGQVLMTIGGATTGTYQYPNEGVYSLHLISGIGAVERPVSGPAIFIQDPTRS
jgi:hypothetical protein